MIFRDPRKSSISLFDLNETGILIMFVGGNGSQNKCTINDYWLTRSVLEITVHLSPNSPAGGGRRLYKAKQCELIRQCSNSQSRVTTRSFQRSSRVRRLSKSRFVACVVLGHVCVDSVVSRWRIPIPDDVVLRVVL